MPLTFPPRRRALAGLLLLLAAAGACGDPVDGMAGDAPPPPAADFVIAAGDSAFWVTSAAGEIHVRGAPIELARVDGRFYELYVVDDDRSFEDATFVGQRVYRRDLLRGDSSLVYEDTLVPHIAAQYARRFPEDTPLGADAPPSDAPRWSATTALDLTDIHGPFISFELHTDVDRDDAPQWHTTRRGVIDLRAGGLASLAEVAGSAPSLATVEAQRLLVMRAALDSVRANATERGARASAALGFYRLDPASYALTTVDGGPAVAYALAGMGDGDGGLLLPLPPIRIEEPAWWPAVAATLPVGSANGARDVWRHGRYEVVAHYELAAGSARLALRDSTSREWPVARIPAPADRVFWLDAPPLDSAARLALMRAFEQSTLYDEEVRTAAHDRLRPFSRQRLAARRLPAVRHQGPHPRSTSISFTPARRAVPHA